MKPQKKTNICWATYHGKGGYEIEQQQANKIFKIGKRYLVIGGTIDRYSTELILKNIPSSWNSCLFHVNLEKAPVYHLYYYKA
jgi:hypothetical protein